MFPSRLRRRSAFAVLSSAVLSLIVLAPHSSAVAEPVPGDGIPTLAEPVADEPTADSSSAESDSAESEFPTARTTGVPRGWVPERTVVGDVRVVEAGAEVSDLRIIRGNLIVDAPDVTVRRVEVRGGRIDNFAGPTCHTGLRIVDSTVRRAVGVPTSGDMPVVGTGGYVAEGVKIVGVSEGFRVGGKDDCGGVEIHRSFVRVVSPDICGDWHGDALQGYDGGHLVVRDSVLRLVELPGCGGTAPFFYPADQGNTSVDIDGLVVSGGGFAFRLGMPGPVRRLHVEEGMFGYGPLDVLCPLVDAWEASISALGEGGQPEPVEDLTCGS